MEQLIYFYDDANKQTLAIPPNQIPDPSWIRISELYAKTLSDAQAQGDVLYLNNQGMPTSHVAPPKPVLRWDETATLNAPAIINGAVTQEWAVTKITLDEKIKKIAEYRVQRQHSQVFQVRIVRTTPDGDPIYYPAVTDPGTWNMFVATYLKAASQPSRVFDWKFDDAHYEDVLGEEIVKAYLTAADLVEKQFTIERRYLEAVRAGREVDLYAWSENP
jgi:hypothetical protein